jgi:leader peptidase (prepilin peptidase)/N-methyltransferase
MEETQSKGEEPLLGKRAIAWAAGLSLCLLGGLLFLVPPAVAVFGAYLFLSMTLITLADLRHFIIPDVLSLPAIPAGLMASAFLHPGGEWPAGFASGLGGALIGGGVFYLLRTAYFRLRGTEGLGLGDVKLAAVAGAWLGPAALAPACLVATLSALAAVLLHGVLKSSGEIDAHRHVPFGSFIAPTILVFWMGQILGDAIQIW